jgi:GT2 family glycosyltransferase
VESPTVTIVIVVYNRRDELRETLRRMLVESDYDPKRVDAIVVDNASHDGSATMVREEFPQVRLIERATNAGAPAWNDGFAIAGGDYVLILDDDCYLEPDGLRRAVAAAEEHASDLVSFRVVSTRDPRWVFSDRYPTGLLSFWGCAWLVRRSALEDLGGYDPHIFMWGNELDFTIRSYDRGYRHLHLPEVVAHHMKGPGSTDGTQDPMVYRVDARHHAYVAAKLLRPRDASAVLAALMARSVNHGLRVDRAALVGVPSAIRGFAHGIRRRRPVRSRELSRRYRRDFHTFVSPLQLTRRRRERFFADRADLYPRERAVLDFRRDRSRGGRD